MTLVFLFTFTAQVGQETFRLCRELVDGIVLVDNSAVSAAIKDVFNETRSILEPAGALAVAGAKAWLKRNSMKGESWQAHMYDSSTKPTCHTACSLQ